MGFTYEKPDDEAFFETLIKYLRQKGENELLKLVSGAKCGISASSSFSRRRWDALWTEIRFYLPVERLGEVTTESEEKLRKICDNIIPIEAGLDVMNVEFAPLVSKTQEDQDLIESLEETTQTLSQEVISQVLPPEVRQKGKEMAEVYLYLYCVENTLRLFIMKVALEKLGNDYFNKLSISKGIKENVSRRKQEENKNKWLRVRGDSEIFYLDFSDLSSVIQNNWDLFKDYFPDMNWIVTKVKELVDCRNLVAHNSYVQSHEKDVIRINYISILKQLDETLAK